MTDTATLPAVEPMLVLSTAHLTDATCNVFLPAYDGPAWRKGDYGWFVYVADEPDADLPADLIACLDEARRVGACWLMFDRDAATIVSLPSYNW